MALHEVLANRRDDVLGRWKTLVHGTLALGSMPQTELVDHLPQFVDEIVIALKEDATPSATNPLGPRTMIAAGHGAQRLRLGFSLDAVVREYGSLREAVITVGRDEGADVTYRELEIVFDCIISGIAHAVTEYTRQRDAELLRHANEHFAFIAHELRNPLSAAMMAFSQLKRGGHLPTEGRAVGVLERSLVRTSSLIDETLQIARVASGIEIHRAWTTLGAVLEDVELVAISEAESKGVELRTEIREDADLNVDIRLLRSAVSNLVRNAVKYTTSGKVELRGRVANGRAIIEVEDACGGLEPGQVEAAFAPFVRLDKGQTGFGLGLAIAKQAVDAHGGTVRVQNLPKKGCIFVLDLPVSIDP